MFKHHIHFARNIVALAFCAALLLPAAPLQAASRCRQQVYLPFVGNESIAVQAAAQIEAANFGIDPVIGIKKTALGPIYADFNGDGCADLAIGVPKEAIADNSIISGGAVNVLYGSFSGITLDGDQVFTQATPDVAGAPEAADQLGTALTAGDFNGDGYLDLAASAPYEDVDNNTVIDGGAVNIFYGSENGLNAQGSWIFSQATDGIEGKADPNDRLGDALAAGDFNGDGYMDLAAGAPLEDIDNDSKVDGGAINIVYGSQNGLTADGDQIFSQVELAGAAEDGDLLGKALAAGDFNGDGYMDLAAGAPGEDIDNNTKSNGGAVVIVYGSKDGLKADTSQIFSQVELAGAAEADDRLGEALATGDFNDDGYVDLVAGAPEEDIDGNSKFNGGAFIVIYGSKDGLKADTSQIFSQVELAGDAEAGDELGSSLATGDFNGDGYMDVAAGAKREDINGETANQGGAVVIVYGSENGLTAQDSAMFSQATTGVPGAPESEDHLGWSVTAGDYNGDGYIDVATGAPWEDIDNNSKKDGGAVNVFYGSPDGITSEGSQIFSQADAELQGAPEEGDRFGWAVR